MRSRRAAAPPIAAFTALAMLLAGPMSDVLARLSNTASAGANVLAAGQVFSGARSTTAWTVSDASSGSAATQNDVLSYASDARTKTTGAWAAAFATPRYFELTFQPVLAPGVAISTVFFNFDFRPSAVSSNACFYFEVRTASTSAVLATYGSSTTPVTCNATTTLSVTSTSIPILTSTTQANDLAVRVYMTNSGTTKTVIIDRATISGTTPFQSFTLFQKQYADASTGTAATTIWPFATNDTTNYTSAAVWAAASASTRFLSLTFPPYVPASGATVSTVTLNRVYRAAVAGDMVCWYMDVLNGATVLGTHGSSGTPISCSSSNTTFTSDTVTLSEVDTAAKANALTVKIYARSSALNKTVDTLDLLSVTWSRP